MTSKVDPLSFSMESLPNEQRLLLSEGGQLDDYDVLNPIGKGKFSVVYKAKRRYDGQVVALKKIAIFDITNLKAYDKTLKEVRLVQSVCHPNIIQYLDAFVQSNELCIAFEWAEGGDLKRQIQKVHEKGMHFDESTVWRYFTQLCVAMLYLHQSRIMHRDLKPANIFLTLQGVVKVGDLGLSRYLSENTLEARSKVGTPLYMSPEVLRGESYGWKSDVWSMGCILYELAMLRSPFQSKGLTLVDLFQKINKGYYETISTIYSEHLRHLVDRMIALTATDRPSVQEVYELCQLRLSEAAEQKPKHFQNDNVARSKAPSTRSARSEGNKSKLAPESKTQLRSSPCNHKPEISYPSRPLLLQKCTSSAATDGSRRKNHAGMRMELLFERLKILRYENILKKPITPMHFAFDSQTLPKVSCRSRFEDMCKLAYWLISLLGYEITRSEASPTVLAEQILVAAERAKALAVGHLRALNLTSGVGIDVCELLDALTVAVIRSKACCTAPATYRSESDELCDRTDDDALQHKSSDQVAESTASLVMENDDVLLCWVVVKEEGQHCERAGKEEKATIVTNIDPVAWELERRRLIPKLHAGLHDHFQRRPIESSWHVRLAQAQTQLGLIDASKDRVLHGIATIQAAQQKQTDSLARLETHLNRRFLRARRLYHEASTRLKESREEILVAQGRVNRATVKALNLQAAHAEQATKLNAAIIQITDDSHLLERKRRVQSLTKENRQLGMKLQVLQDYWTRKQFI